MITATREFTIPAATDIPQSTCSILPKIIYNTSTSFLISIGVEKQAKISYKVLTLTAISYIHVMRYTCNLLTGTLLKMLQNNNQGYRLVHKNDVWHLDQRLYLINISFSSISLAWLHWTRLIHLYYSTKLVYLYFSQNHLILYGAIYMILYRSQPDIIYHN